jgi:antitoxin YefM
VCRSEVRVGLYNPWIKTYLLFAARAPALQRQRWVMPPLDARTSFCTAFLYNNSDLMATKTSYSHARENLAALWDEVENSREAAVIQRRGHEEMALVPADELASLRETTYLLRSPQNAVRLLAASSSSPTSSGCSSPSNDLRERDARRWRLHPRYVRQCRRPARRGDLHQRGPCAVGIPGANPMRECGALDGRHARL